MIKYTKITSVETERKPQDRNSFAVTYIPSRHKHPLGALIIHTSFLVIGSWSTSASNSSEITITTITRE